MGGSGDRRRRRRVLSGVAAASVVLTVFLAWAAWGALSAREDLEAGSVAMTAAQQAIEDLDMRTAASSLRRAEAHFSHAADRLGNPMLSAAGVVPVAGANVDAVRALAAGGRDVAAAAAIVVSHVEDAGGIGAFTPRDGRLPVYAVKRLHQPLEEAVAVLAGAAAAVEASPSVGLATEVANARRQFLEAVSHAERQLTPVTTLTDVLPAFLGAGEPRRYLLVAQNPAELRGTGGFMGAFAVLEADAGRVSVSDFQPIQELPNPPRGAVTPPDPQFAARYDRFGGMANWRNLNFTAHFPWVGEAAVALYEHSQGIAMDGVVAVDPHALAALLEMTGPVPAPTGGMVDATNVVEYVANEAYDPLQPTGQRKELLGDVATTAFRAFMNGDRLGDPRGMVAALGAIAGRGHLLLYSTRADEQAAFVGMHVAGAQHPDTGDYLAVVANNLAANKADFYTRRVVRYEMALQPDGSGLAHLEVRVVNETPTDGPPEHVIGPNLAGLDAGDNRTLITAFCGFGCTDATGGDVHGERGLTGISQVVRVPSGKTGVATFSWRVPDVWSTDPSGGSYRLAFENQVTVRPTQLIVQVSPPRGWSIARGDDPDRVVVRRLPAQGRESITVELQPDA